MSLEWRKLADAVCFDDPELAPMFDWAEQEPAHIVSDAIREICDRLDDQREELAQWKARTKAAEAELGMADARLFEATRDLNRRAEKAEAELARVTAEAAVMRECAEAMQKALAALDAKLSK